MARKRPLA